MTREGKWPLAATVAVVLATVLLAACGGSDSSSSTEATSTGDSTTSAQNSGGQQSQEGQDQAGSQEQSKNQDSHRGGNSSQGDRQRKSSSSKNAVVAPLNVSGGGSTQFRTKGGDNSIQEFGEESESELQEVAEIVHGFYAARAEENWNAACSYLAKPNVEQLVELVSQAPELKSAGCSGALRAFTRPLPPALEREITTIDAGSFRREGEQGFLIYYGPDRTVYSMPMREEDGAWKVAALSGSAIG